MVGAKQVATSGVGVGAGVGSTLLIRSQLDQSGETSVLRPSVLWGVSTGLLGLGVPLAMDSRRDSVLMEAVEDYAWAALASGAFSAFSPVGTGVQAPSL